MHAYVNYVPSVNLFYFILTYHKTYSILHKRGYYAHPTLKNKLRYVAAGYNDVEFI